MGLEIERKFLVDQSKWDAVTKGEGLQCIQTYLNNEPEKTIRVRVLGEKGYLTIKGKTENLTRTEFEYEIPQPEAEEMIAKFGKHVLIKTRYFIQVGAHTWEVDVFDGDNVGLIVAEVELSSENESFEVPNWIGEEVSLDERYYNACLQKHPYTKWKTK